MNPLASAAPMTTLTPMDDEPRAIAYAALAAWWAVCAFLVSELTPSAPGWAVALTGCLLAIVTCMPAALAASILWHAALGIADAVIDGWREAAPGPRRPTWSTRRRSIRGSPPA